MKDRQTESDVIKAIRILSARQVEAAGSGHPGTPLGAAPVMATLYGRFMNVVPDDPCFYDRDRFVLSSGHASAMLYSTLHICGYDVKAEDLAAFRQEGSRTPGHPEAGVTPGVDCSTGPLGQGVANAVGMALAERILSARFNRPGSTLVDHYTYAFCGDGCMMEGIENEAASLAAMWKLGKLILIYDSNGITIEGDTHISLTEDIAKRHRALGWHVVRAGNVENTDALAVAIEEAKAEDGRPSLIIVSSKIGYGAPNEGTSSVHGSPLGAEGMAKLAEKLEWKCSGFELPDDVKAFREEMKAKGRAYKAEREARMERAKAAYPALRAEFDKYLSGAYMAEAADKITALAPEGSDSTRSICGKLLAAADGMIPNLVGGSADLAPSNCTAIKGKEYYSATASANGALHFGVREHAMAAICNGIALHGGLLPFCSTFFVFSDYMKYAMRMSALMKLPVTYILSHDSIGVGEDGPTHQPVEQLAGLRAMPGLYVFRPCDGRETAAAMSFALSGKAPTAIVTSRQKLPACESSDVSGALRGAYVIAEGGDCVLMASGSEVGLCLQARELLEKRGIRARVVSVPCMELFAEQSEEYRNSVLPRSVRARVAVEAASRQSWGGFVGLDGDYVCMDGFGKSAPASVLMKKYGFTAENIADKTENIARACRAAK